MRFTKMEGLGNDYIYLNCLSRRPPDPPPPPRGGGPGSPTATLVWGRMA